MRLYIAAPWIHRDDMPTIAAQFEEAGHTVTHKWWEAKSIPESKWTADGLCSQAVADRDGVLTADVVVLINSARSEGKAVEQGIAIAQGKHIIAVGERGALSMNVFHYLPNYIWVATVEEAIGACRPI
jgi:nucleoside 2-deoxyribosyltransferase